MSLCEPSFLVKNSISMYVTWKVWGQVIFISHLIKNKMQQINRCKGYEDICAKFQHFCPKHAHKQPPKVSLYYQRSAKSGVRKNCFTMKSTASKTLKALLRSALTRPKPSLSSSIQVSMSSQWKIGLVCCRFGGWTSIHCFKH